MKLFKNIDFDNSTLQDKEEIILGVLLESEKIINSDPGLNNPLRDGIVQLFESASSMSYNQNLFKDYITSVDSESYFGNRFAYLNDVKNLMENNVPANSTLKSDESFKTFYETIKTYVTDLKKQNDFDRYESLNELILKTKILAKQPIYVMGFDISDIESLKSHFGFKELFAIVYNKSDKEIMFVAPNHIVSYSIESNDMKNATVSKLTIDNFQAFISDNITQNYQILYKKMNLTFSDNLYFDNERLKVVAQLKQQKTINSIFK